MVAGFGSMGKGRASKAHQRACEQRAQVPVREMNRAAAADGWVVLRNGEHRCKACVAETLKAGGGKGGDT